MLYCSILLHITYYSTNVTDKVKRRLVWLYDIFKLVLEGRIARKTVNQWYFFNNILVDWAIKRIYK
jgi:hypothetical protein